MAITIHSISNVDGDAEKTYEFCGLSSDSKPTEIDGKPIEANSLFLELDTKDFYYLATQTTYEDNVLINETSFTASKMYPEDTCYSASIGNFDPTENEKIEVIFDGVTYECERQYDSKYSNYYYGCYYDQFNAVLYPDEYPFNLIPYDDGSDYSTITVADGNAHTIKAIGSPIKVTGEWAKIGTSVD